MKRLTPFLVVFALLAFVQVASAQTVVVSGNTSTGENQPGWLFNRDVTTATPFEFNTNASSIGSGSLYVLPIGVTPADKFIGENFVAAQIADVNSISYDFMIGAGGDATDANHFYMSVYANFGVSDPNKFYDCRYNVVPATGSTLDFTTVTFDPTLSYPVTRSSTSPTASCPSSPADMGSGAVIRVFALNVGDTSASDVGLDGYLDNVVVDLASGATTYDFDPAPTTAVTKDDCKNGGWMTLGFKNQGQCIREFNTSKDSR